MNATSVANVFILHAMKLIVYTSSKHLEEKKPVLLLSLFSLLLLSPLSFHLKSPPDKKEGETSGLRRQTRVRVKHSLLEFYGVDWLTRCDTAAKRNTKHNRSGSEIESICSELQQLLHGQILAWEDWGKQDCGKFTRVKRIFPRFWECRGKFSVS